MQLLKYGISHLQQLDAQLVDIRNAYDEGKRADDNTRVQAVKDRIQQKTEKAGAEKEKVKETADKRQSQFKLVTSRDQEIIDWESKGSYIAKQVSSRTRLRLVTPMMEVSCL